MATATASMNTGMMTMPTGSEMAPATANNPGNNANGSMALTTAPGTTPNAAANNGLNVWQNLGISDTFSKALNQPSVRKVLPLILMLAVLVVFLLAYAWMQSTPYRPVMPGLQEADQQAAFESLKTADFKPKIDPATGQLTVPTNRFHEARILLASQGLPKAGTTGMEGLKDQSSMTTSQLMEQVKINTALEQELARSIMQIGTVQSARVHLATPKQSVFVRDRTPPKASVVLAPYPGRAVSASQVQAIVHLVSSSVPYLAPDHVTVVDTVGKLMTESATEQKLGLTSAQEQHKQHLEEVYRNRIMQILSPMLGEGNVRSQVNLTLDFTQTESTTEDFDNREKGPRTRSEVLAEDRSASKSAEGVPGALSNTPPPDPTTTNNTQVDGAKGQADSTGKLSSRATRNFEIDRTVRHVRNASGGVMKVSVAVLVNERPVTEKSTDPKAPKSVPFTPQELEQMQQVVRGVVGFDPTRGDSVSVVPAKFEAPAPLETIPWYLEDMVQSGITSALIAISFIAFMMIVVRPIMRNLYDTKAEAEASAMAALADGELSADDMRMIQIGEGESLEEIKAKLKPKKSSISMDMLDTANTYDDKVALIRMLVAEDSGRVANVLKSMVKVN
jgi:flagellar M-ring protein FliF